MRTARFGLGLGLSLWNAALRGGSAGGFAPPTADGINADIYADFADGNYWASGAQQATFAAWLTAIGGTFTRASTAYRTNASGLLESTATNVLRFDHDPLTLLPKGILLEGARTNIALRSQEFDTTWLFLNAGITANQYVAPDGTTTMDKLVPVADSNTHKTYQTITWTAAVYVTSVYVRYVNKRWLAITTYDGTTERNVSFDLLNGAVGALLNATGLITDLGGGLYRCSVTGSSAQAAAAGNFGFTMNNTNVAGNETWNAVGTEAVGLWGAQVAVGSVPSSYIPTTTVSVTRAADSLAAAISAVSSGTIYAKAQTRSITMAQRIFQIDDGTANNRASLNFNASAAGAFDLLDATVSQAAMTAGTIAANTVAKLAAAFATNDYALVVAGGTPATDASGSVPAGLTVLRFGADSAGVNGLFGNIEELAVWGSLRATNGALQSLTA